MRKSIWLFMSVLLLNGLAFAGGSISGTVKFEGPAPKNKPIKMDADPVCSAKHDSPLIYEYLVLGEGNTMANIFVRVINPPSGDYKTPETFAVLDQKGCRYSPHVQGVMVNQPIEILNPDGTLHNVHALAKVNREFNQAMPKFKKKIVKKFAKEEFMITLKCDVHPWMSCYIGVSSHPFFAVTAEDGKFEISGLPPGTYEIEAWHEKLGTKTATVTVQDDTSAKADFSFTSAKKK